MNKSFLPVWRVRSTYSVEIRNFGHAICRLKFYRHAYSDKTQSLLVFENRINHFPSKGKFLAIKLA